MSKKNFKNPADEFLSVKPKEVQDIKENIIDNSDSNNNKNINYNRISNRTISDIFDNIKDDKTDGATRSFYLSNQTFNALVQKAKAKNISNSKFLEGILSQLFFENE